MQPQKHGEAEEGVGRLLLGRCQLGWLWSLLRHLTATLDGDQDQAVFQWYSDQEIRVAQVATI